MSSYSGKTNSQRHRCGSKRAQTLPASHARWHVPSKGSIRRGVAATLIVPLFILVLLIPSLKMWNSWGERVERI